MSRFAAMRPPGGLEESVRFEGDWEEFCSQRKKFNRQILRWAASVEAIWFERELS
jgi:hypothetical protein